MSELSGLGEGSWELRHWRWVHEDRNTCRECERDRGPHGPTAYERWTYALVARAGRWHGTLVPLLRDWSRRLRGGVLVRNRDTSPATYPDPELGELRRVVEDIDFQLEALERRGPVQSVPEWELAVDAADAASRRAWAAYADAVWASDAYHEVTG